ncbi:MAG TPA: peptide MFS transporter [Flavipsychrobacter sp.]|nr:peptide MFS transporter [Flavipsychrobacter sp.]
MNQTTSTTVASKHPKGLPFLFLTEMWERFGYYLMLGIFFLYMKAAKTDGGMGFDPGDASDIFGTYIALTYLTPFIGGFLADRKIGYINAVYFGGILMGLGYLGFSLEGTTAFYISMALVIIGNGFFKPSISTLLGNLYSTDTYRDKKDSGFNIFYMGINIGAFICNIIAAFMRNKYGWDEAFMTAGIGMFIGLIVFSLGLKNYRSANILKPAQKGDITIGNLFAIVFLPAIIAGYLGWIIPNNIFGSDSTDAFIFACVPVIFYFVSIYLKAPQDDKRPIAALLAIFAVSIMFWAVFKQNGTVLTTWAESYTDRKVSGSTEKFASDLYLADKVVFAKDTITAYDKNFKLLKENGQEVKIYDYPKYFSNMPADQRPEEGQAIYTANPELFQSINPFWVVALTPLVVGFFALLKRRGKEPTTPGKIAWGMLISALSCLVMVAAVHYSMNGTIKVSALWLIACYGVITVGELFLSPMGLSLVSKLSPPRITALMMGGFFLSTSIGNKLSGVLAKTWYNYENKQLFFIVNFCLLIIAAAIGFSLLKWMNKIMKEKGLR